MTKQTHKPLKELTVKELAIEYTKDIDRLDLEGGKRIYSDDDFIKLLTTNVKQKNFAIWTECYYVYNEATYVFGMHFGELIEAVEIMRGYLRLWESYQQEEAHLNALLEAMRELNGVDENLCNVAVETLKETALKGKYTLADINFGNDGYFVIDCSKLFKAIDRDMPTFIRRYQEMKELIIGVERWEKTIKTTEFRPSLVQYYIDEAKSDLSLSVAPMYSRKELHLRESKGMKITAHERQCAIFPYYEELKYNEDTVKLWADRFKSAYEYRKKTTEDKLLRC